MAQPRRPVVPNFGNQSGNRLLAALPPDQYDRLRPLLTTVELEHREAIALPNQPIEAVYFPIDSVTSVLALTPDGGRIEVATVGNEGMAGLPLFLGVESSPGYAFTQVPGRAERMDADAFRHQLNNGAALRRVLERYTQGFLTQVSQATVCNQCHAAQRRLARWLLAVQDRVGREEFSITHEFLGQMLGVRRETVTELAGALQERGLIRYRRGRMTIQDREGLEREACECYWVVRREFERLLSAPTG